MSAQATSQVMRRTDVRRPSAEDARPAWRGVVSGLVGAAAWKRAGYAAVMAPLSVAGLVGGAPAGRLLRRVRGAASLREFRGPRPVSLTPARVVAFSLTSLPVALTALLTLLLTLPNTVRQLTYPLTHPDVQDYVHAWGGPTLAGAWAAHAAIGLVLLPVYLLALRGLGYVQTRLGDRIFAGRRGFWLAPVLVALVLVVALAVRLVLR